MQIVVSGHQVEITEALKNYAQKKMEKIEHFFEKIQRLEVKLEYRQVSEVEKRQVCQVNIAARGRILRAEAVSADMYASIDLVFGKLEHQIVKYKEKLIKERRRDKRSALIEPMTEDHV